MPCIPEALGGFCVPGMFIIGQTEVFSPPPHPGCVQGHSMNKVLVAHLMSMVRPCKNTSLLWKYDCFQGGEAGQAQGGLWVRAVLARGLPHLLSM